GGTTAGVVIGDRALEQRLTSPYIYDLAEAWRNFTGLPFVFAAWIANKELPESFCKLFNEANAIGLNELDKVVAENPYNTYYLNKIILNYFLKQKIFNCISYSAFFSVLINGC